MIKKAILTNGTELWFGKGRIDDFCIYVAITGNKKILQPLDEYIFERMRKMADWKINGGPYKTYSNFLELYEKTGKEMEQSVIDLIKDMAKDYFHRDEAELIFAYLYLGMIAEENREGTKLGKRIKRLGVRQVLLEDMTPREAANYSRYMPWREISMACVDRGF